MRLQNSIRKQTLAFAVNSEVLALMLQPRLSDLNRHRFLPVIEKVLDDLAVPGRQIKIPLLDLDLGVLPLEGFEDAAVERLDKVLRHALEAIVLAHGGNNRSNFRSQTEEASRLELLEFYLLSGTLPFWAPRESLFSLEELVQSLTTSAPQNVTAIIRQHGRHRRVLERLVLQLSDAALHRLLYLLEPQHAMLIIIYMIDLKAVHRVTPVLAVSDQRFARLLWILVMSYLVQDAGSQFNRKSFVRSLLEGMAESEGLDYIKIITTLDLGLRKTGKKRSFKSSLPAIISELVHELPVLDLEECASHGDVSNESRTEATLLRMLVKKYPADAKHFLYSLHDNRTMLTAVAGRCSPALFAGVLQLLRPREAVMLIALAQIFARIPAPYRPQSEEAMRYAMLDELLLLKDDQPLTETFFANLLRRLCGGLSSNSNRIPGAYLTFSCLCTKGPDRTSLCNLCVLCASVVKELFDTTTTETQRTQRLHREISLFVQSSFFSESAGNTTGGALVPATRRRPPIPREAVFAFLLGEHRILWKLAGKDAQVGQPRAQQVSNDALLHSLNLILEEPTEELSAFISRHMADPLRREHWAKVLPESALVRLSYLLEPRKHRTLLRAAEMLASAWLEAVPYGHPTLSSRELFWNFLLEFLHRNSSANRSISRLAIAFSEFFASRYLAALPGANNSANVGAVMLDHACRLASNAGHTNLLAILQHDRALLLAPWKLAVTAMIRTDHTDLARPGTQIETAGKSPLVQRSRRKMVFSMYDEEHDVRATDPIYINNAGLVLTGPFLPQLFHTLDMFSPNEDSGPRLRDPETVSRAVHLLQYLVDGRTSAPEPLLVLNKILCGVPKGTPIESAIELTDWERETCGRMLKSMIANWKIIEHSSVAALQQTFLLREGKLEQTADGWKLQVQRKTVDVLVDRIPWTISIVYHRWMPQPLYINW